MKKIFSVLLSTIMLLSVGSISASAAYPKSATVNVTISNDNLEFEIAQAPVFVTDLNNDDKLTIEEALVCAHNAYFPGGADAGYKSSNGFIQKVWGVETSYIMYTVNDVFTTNGVDDEIKNNDYLHLYLIKDTNSWSDNYSFFDVDTKNLIEGEDMTVTLNTTIFDMATSSYVTNTIENATITVNGVPTNVKTDANGKATIKATQLGKNTISATSEDCVLVPPIMTLNVSPKSANVYVSVVDDNKEFKLTQEKINVTDINNDHLLSIDDAFICAHNQKFDGGASNGYKHIDGFIVKFWGIENGGSYGYYQNNNSAMSLYDMISEGDYIDAFVYSDAANYSDVFTFFDTHTKEVKSNENVTLNLTQINYALGGNMPVENAVISINGVETTNKTDANGNVTLSFTEPGSYTITATSDDFNMVPSVCTITVLGATDTNGNDTNNDSQFNNSNTNDSTQAPTTDNVKSPQTGSENFTILFALSFATLGLILVNIRKSNKYEK